MRSSSLNKSLSHCKQPIPTPYNNITYTCSLKKNSHFTSKIIDYAISMPDANNPDEKKLYK